MKICNIRNMPNVIRVCECGETQKTTVSGGKWNLKKRGPNEDNQVENQTSEGKGLKGEGKE